MSETGEKLIFKAGKPLVSKIGKELIFKTRKPLVSKIRKELIFKTRKPLVSKIGKELIFKFRESLVSQVGKKLVFKARKPLVSFIKTHWIYHFYTPFIRYTICYVYLMKRLRLRPMFGIIAQHNFYAFKEWVLTKCQKHGIVLRLVDRWYRPPKICSSFGVKKTELSLSERKFNCDNCYTKQFLCATKKAAHTDGF